MNNNGQITKSTREVTRPLRTLVPLIKRDLHGLENSGKPFRYSIGKNLAEASENHEELKKAGGWYAWLKKNFAMARSTAHTYIAFYESASRQAKRSGARGARFKTQEEESEAYTKFAKRGDKHRKRAYKERRETIGGILGGIDADLYAQKISDRLKEIDLRRDLGTKVVEAGFRLLAKELHPDKGGTSELMRRLQAVRKRLLDLCQMIGSEVEISE
jgi:hypothetical protein